MDFFTTFIITTIPAGVSTLFLIINKRNIDNVLLKLDNQYISKYFSQNLLRIVKAYKIGSFLTKKERNLLLITILCRTIGLITVVLWGMLFLFFPDKILP